MFSKLTTKKKCRPDPGSNIDVRVLRIDESPENSRSIRFPSTVFVAAPKAIVISVPDMDGNSPWSGDLEVR
jgi:hypothetical protein